MKIIRSGVYCYPELTASAHLENDRLEYFANVGFEVVIYAPTPNRGIDTETYKKYKNIKYEELYGSAVKIKRFSMFRERKNPLLRAVRYFFINVAQYFKYINTENVDVLYSGSTPPTQGMLCGLAKKKLSKKAKKSIPLVYNLQDIFPDSLVTTGLTKEGSLIWKIGRKIENYTYKNSDKIIVISEAFKKNIMAKGVPEEKIEVIPNWIDTETVKPVPKCENRLYEEYGISRDKFTVVYAGNFGAAQGADVVLKAANLLKDEDIQFVIFGGGSQFENAKSFVTENNLCNVFIDGLLPQERVSEVYSLGDIALITCKKGVGGSGMPSKTWTIMATGTPIVASFDADSELADIIKKANAGVCVEPENEKLLAQTIKQMKNDGKDKAEYNGRSFVSNFASKEKCVSKYVEVIEKAYKKSCE